MAVGGTTVSDFLLSNCVIGLVLACSIILHCTNKKHKKKASKLNAKLFIFQKNVTMCQSIFAPLHKAIFSRKQFDKLNIAFF